MKEFAKQFYKSAAWKNCSKAYAKSQQNLCERCLQNGEIKAGEMVHHKVYLTPENITDPSITLDWNNLELLCFDCHNKEHFKKQRRYKIDEFGNVTARE